MPSVSSEVLALPRRSLREVCHRARRSRDLGADGTPESALGGVTTDYSGAAGPLSHHGYADGGGVEARRVSSPLHHPEPVAQA